MEYKSEFVNVRLSIVKDGVEYTGSSLRFDRPSSRLMQLQVCMGYRLVLNDIEVYGFLR